MLKRALFSDRITVKLHSDSRATPLLKTTGSPDKTSRQITSQRQKNSEQSKHSVFLKCCKKQPDFPRNNKQNGRHLKMYLTLCWKKNNVREKSQVDTTLSEKTVLEIVYYEERTTQTRRKLPVLWRRRCLAAVECLSLVISMYYSKGFFRVSQWDWFKILDLEGVKLQRAQSFPASYFLEKFSYFLLSKRLYSCNTMNLSRNIMTYSCSIMISFS